MQPYMKLQGVNSPAFTQHASQATKDFWARNPGGNPGGRPAIGSPDQQAIQQRIGQGGSAWNRFGYQDKPGTGGGGHGDGGLNYQSGFNANGQAINTGNIMDRLGKEGNYSAQHGSATGKQGTSDLSRSLSRNDAAQLTRGIEKENAQQNMQNQVTRSELMQSGLSNQAKIYGDMAQRENDQVGLAAKLQESMIRNRFALAQALLSQVQG